MSVIHVRACAEIMYMFVWFCMCNIDGHVTLLLTKKKQMSVAVSTVNSLNKWLTK